MLLCPNVVVNITNEMNRKRKLFNFGTLKRLVLLLNVGKRNGQTFIGSINNSGNHWVLVVVEMRPFKRIIYCDTLAWDPPSNILEVINNFTSHMPRVGSYDSSFFSLAHSPLAMSSRLGHACDWRCRNYPLQTCSDICGVIAVINAALAALDRPLFQYLIGPYEKEAIYLQHPSQHSYYLRRVLMSWFAEGRIDIEYVLLQPGWRDNVTTKSDHSFCFRQDTAGNSKKKFKLSLNRKESPSGLSPETAQDHSPSGKCSSRTSFAARSATNSKTSVPDDTNQSLSGSSSVPTHPVSPEATSSPQLKKSKPQLSSNRVPSLSRKRPSSGISSHLSKKSKKPADSSGKCPSTAKSTSPSPTTDPSPSLDAKCNSSLTATPPSKTGTSSALGNSVAALTSSANNDCHGQPSANTELPTSSAATPTSSKIETATESSCNPAPPPRVVSQFQCEDCGLKLSSRNCLYKHKKRKHKTTHEGNKAKESKPVVCPECSGNQSR